MIRVMIIESHDLVRLALETRLRAAADLEVLGSIGEYRHAPRQAQRLAPDVILMETKAPQGIETLQRLCCTLPGCSIIVLTSYLDSREEDLTRQLGASCYLLKSLDTRTLVGQIRSAVRSANQAGGGAMQLTD